MRRGLTTVVSADQSLLTFDFGFDFSQTLGELLLEEQRLQPLLVVVDPDGQETEVDVRKQVSHTRVTDSD